MPATCVPSPFETSPAAVRNLTRRRARPQIKQAPAAAMFVLDGNLESSLLLVDHLWEQIAPQLPGELIAAVPSRPDGLIRDVCGAVQDTECVIIAE